jgi:hypothetical protein
MKVNGDEHSSLILLGINYNRKNIFGTSSGCSIHKISYDHLMLRIT